MNRLIFISEKNEEEEVQMCGMIAFCGLHCDTCPIYLLTRISDKREREEMKAEIIRICREQYGLVHDPEEITGCDGCTTENGRLFSTCANCEIRKCARQKGIENCAYCSEYQCDKLDEIFAAEPAAGNCLNEIRDRMQTPDALIRL